MTIARFLRICRHRWRSALRKDTVDREVARELAFHFEQLVGEHLAAGLPPDAARAAARQALGNVALLEEQCRDQRRVTWLHDLRQDLAYGLRILRRNPAFTAVATASLALGIGANAAVLAAIDAAFLGPLPIPDGDRIVAIRTAPSDNPQAATNASAGDYLAWKERSRAFEAIGASFPLYAALGADAGSTAERISGHLFTPDMFAVLGSRPLLGRVFTQEEAQRTGGATAVVIGHGLWQRRFAADPGILDRAIRLNGRPATIVGVMPADFRYPALALELIAPLRLERPRPDQTPGRTLVVLARLRTGVTTARAEADLNAIGADAGIERGWVARLQPLRDVVFGWTRRPLLTLQAAVALVLAIACVNVAGLLLARGAARQPEIALRMALGAGRGRILRQLLAEGILLAAIGGLLGVGVAWLGVKGLTTMGPNPGGLALAPAGLSAWTLGAIVALAAGTGLAFSLAPGFAGVAGGSVGRFRPAGAAAQRRSPQPLWAGLAAAQIALALVVLVVAGLLINSFIRLAGRELNFEPRGLVMFGFRIPMSEYAVPIGLYRGSPYFELRDPPALTLTRVFDHLQALPGVDAVAGISVPHVNSFVVPAVSVVPEGGAAAESSYFLVTPGLFATLRARVVRGRDIDARDTESAPWVAVVNETLARRLWPNEDALGKRITLDTVPDEQPRRVVGIVRDIPVRRDRIDPAPVIYASYRQQPLRARPPLVGTAGGMTFVVRAAGDPLALLPAIRRAVAEVEPDRPIADEALVARHVSHPLPARWTYVNALGAFAVAATLLAALGVYGVMTYTVAQRTRELGIRVALGAGARDVLVLVGARAMLLVGVGVAAGLATALALTRLIASQLWGITATDPATFGGVSVLLTAVAVAAAAVPLNRALRVDPTIALKYE